MKVRIQIALMACLGSIFAHLYLTMHYYPLKFGFAAGNSICNLSAKFDCDAVAASSFSSFAGLPLSVWGMAANGVLFFMILFSWLEWSEHPERLKRWTLLLAGGSFAASLIMAAISFTQMSTYCLFCLSLYVLSAIIFYCFKGLLREPFWLHLKLDPPMLWTESKGVLVALAAIPVLAFLTDQMFMQDLGSEKVEQMVNESLQNWQQSPKQNFVAKPSLVSGPAAETAAMTLVEFADFRCSHCKHASFTLDAFMRSNPDVRFEYYSFPLDGACNEKIESGTGISCRLAAAVVCAEKEGKGWDMHHALFGIQDSVNRMASPSELDAILAQTVSAQGLNWERIQTCIADPLTMDAIRAQAKQGALVDVKGTPTIFVDGRLLQGGHIVPVLQAVRKKAMEIKGVEWLVDKVHKPISEPVH